jgi:hypothetical protein
VWKALSGFVTEETFDYLDGLKYENGGKTFVNDSLLFVSDANGR